MVGGRNLWSSPTHASKGLKVRSPDFHLGKAVVSPPNMLTRVLSEKIKEGPRTLITTGFNGNYVGAWTSTFTGP